MNPPRDDAKRTGCSARAGPDDRGLVEGMLVDGEAP